MQGRFRSRFLLLPLTFFLLPVLLTGCRLLNNKWIRIHRDKNPDVAKVRLKLPSFRGPKERVHQLFVNYQMKDWKGIQDLLTRESDMHYLREKMLDDFKRYVQITAEVWVEDPTFNEAQDRAQVMAEFAVEKIQQGTGSLIRTRGKGMFVLADRGGWDIYGYVGDPFWGDGRSEKAAGK